MGRCRNFKKSHQASHGLPPGPATAPHDLPGFYYDAAKQKYFKIQDNHLAPHGSRYSKYAAKQEAKSKLLEQEADTCRERRLCTRFRRSLILEHPFGARKFLRREIGSPDISMDPKAAWVLGLGKAICTGYRSPVGCLTRDDATGCLIFVTCFQGEVMYARQPRDRRPYNEVSKIDFGPPIDNIALSPARVILATSSMTKPAVHITRLKEPNDILNEGGYVTNDVSVTLWSQDIDTYWASSARPDTTSNDFALATCNGAILFAHTPGSYSFRKCQKFDSNMYGRDKSDVSHFIRQCGLLRALPETCANIPIHAV